MEPKDIGLNKNKRNPPSPPPQQPASCDGECCQLPEIKSGKRSRAGLCLAPGEQNTIALPGQGQTTAPALAGRRNQPGMGGKRGLLFLGHQCLYWGMMQHGPAFVWAPAVPVSSVFIFFASGDRRTEWKNAARFYNLLLEQSCLLPHLPE